MSREYLWFSWIMQRGSSDLDDIHHRRPEEVMIILSVDITEGECRFFKKQRKQRGTNNCFQLTILPIIGQFFQDWRC